MSFQKNKIWTRTRDYSLGSVQRVHHLNPLADNHLNPLAELHHRDANYKGIIKILTRLANELIIFLDTRSLSSLHKLNPNPKSQKIYLKNWNSYAKITESNEFSIEEKIIEKVYFISILGTTSSHIAVISPTMSIIIDSILVFCHFECKSFIIYKQ